jgi:Heterokaryon incompatibility protein (HET)
MTRSINRQYQPDISTFLPPRHLHIFWTAPEIDRFAGLSPAMYTYQPLLHYDDIRVIVLQPKNLSSDGSIHVSLSTYKLEHAPAYEALSYVWGDNRDTVQITANARTVHLGRNLHKALTQLRHDETFRTLWVDAICINQQDLGEKSQQVSRMRDICAKVCSTIMWIGEENVHDMMLFETLRELPKPQMFREW